MRDGQSLCRMHTKGIHRMSVDLKKNNQTVLITGASAGIGKELAACFAKGGHDLVLVARSVDKLEALAESLRQEHDVKVHVEPADLSKAGAAGKLFNAVKRKAVTVDILVNNAGVLEQGAFTDIKPTRHKELIGLNVSAMTDMLAHFLPPMVERGRGRILNVGSISAFYPVPWLATYAATKAYVLSLTESLSEELKDTGVSVTALCPGFTSTEMMTEGMSKLPGFMLGDVKAVAREGYEACMKGEVIRVPGLVNQAIVLTSSATPKWLVRRISGFAGRAIL